MIKQFMLKIRLIFILLSLTTSQLFDASPAYFFYYPNINQTGDQAYLSQRYNLSTKYFYPELNIIRLPGATIRHMRTNESLNFVPVRLMIRSTHSVKHTSSYRNIFSLAVALQIITNQSWSSSWALNDNSKKTILSTSGPCFETRPPSINDITTNLLPLILGLKISTISTNELSLAISALTSSFNAIQISNGNIGVNNIILPRFLGTPLTPDIGSIGNYIHIKGVMSGSMHRVYGSGSSILTNIDLTSAIATLKNAPLEFFILSSSDISSSTIVEQTISIIKAHSPNSSHSIMYPSGLAEIFKTPSGISEAVQSTPPVGLVMMFPIGELSIESLITAEILSQHFNSLSGNTITYIDLRTSWMPIAQSLCLIVYTGPLSNASIIISENNLSLSSYFENLMQSVSAKLTPEYIQNHLRSSWETCLGKSQKQTNSLDAWIDSNNNVIDGFFGWMEEYYGKESVIDDLNHIGDSITSNSIHFRELCNNISSIVLNSSSNFWIFEYSIYNWFTQT